MCGVAGAWAPGGRTVDVGALQAAIAHRGLDGDGVHQRGPVTLCHSRLAIRDLSPASAQPFLVGDCALAWNGELYNADDLRKELVASGLSFATTGDTEVVAQALAVWGVDALPRFRGMFAIAWWDDARQTLLLARDRFGMKPLYYRHEGDGLLFCSLARPLVRSGPDSQFLADFLTIGSVLDVTSLGLSEVEPGTWLTVGPSPAEGRFASISDLAAASAQPPSGRSFAGDFLDAVESHLVSDVPVAHLLSGGVDSTAIALAAARLGHRLHCFTLRRGADDPEPAIAEATARIYGHDLTVVDIDDDLPAAFEDFSSSVDLPSIDGFNVYLATRAIHRGGFKVALMGTGGDEILGGYRHFRWLPAATLVGAVPQALRQPVARQLRSTDTRKRIAEFVANPSIGRYQRMSRTVFPAPEVRQLVGVEPTPAIDGERLGLRSLGKPAGRLLAMRELDTYLRYTLMRDGDANAMSNGVEVRLPFVDAPFATRALAELPAFPREGKRHFVKALSDPWLTRVRQMPKLGFSLPIRSWLCNGLSDQLATVPSALTGHVDTDRVEALLRDVENGRSAIKVWSLVNLAHWLSGQP